MKNPTWSCDLCHSTDLELLYRPVSTQRGLSVYGCGKCGLVQSLPREIQGSGEIRLSSEANWGNIRYGKSLRAEAALQMIRPYLDPTDRLRCLDVGASRGAFLRAFLEGFPRATALAIESDGRLASLFSDNSRIDFVGRPIEETGLPKDSFDLIHCSHTLEHVQSPLRTLKVLAQSLASNGLIYLEVPNLAFTGREDILEEWFIDKHLYHFSERSVMRLLFECALEPIERRVSQFELSLLIARGLKIREPEKTATDMAAIRSGLSDYAETLRQNRERLRDVAGWINEQAEKQKVSLWGAGRLFDQLVRSGLDLSRLEAVVDTYLSELVDRVSGFPLSPPDVLTHLDPDLVVIVSREYSEEISESLRKMKIGARSVSMFDLMGRLAT